MPIERECLCCRVLSNECYERGHCMTISLFMVDRVSHVWLTSVERKCLCCRLSSLTATPMVSLRAWYFPCHACQRWASALMIRIHMTLFPDASVLLDSEKCLEVWKKIPMSYLYHFTQVLWYRSVQDDVRFFFFFFSAFDDCLESPAKPLVSLTEGVVCTNPECRYLLKSMWGLCLPWPLQPNA